MILFLLYELYLESCRFYCGRSAMLLSVYDGEKIKMTARKALCVFFLLPDSLGLVAALNSTGLAPFSTSGATK